MSSKARVVIVVLTLVMSSLALLVTLASARWRVEQGWVVQVERICTNGMVFAAIQNGKPPATWDTDSDGLPWNTRSIEVEHADGTSEPIKLVSSATGTFGETPWPGVESLTSYEVLRWENSLVPGDFVNILLWTHDEGEDIRPSGVVEDCTIAPEFPAPSLFRACSDANAMTSSDANPEIDFPANIEILDLDITMHVTGIAGNPISATLSSPNQTGIQLFSDLAGLTDVGRDSQRCDYFDFGEEDGELEYSDRLVLDDEGYEDIVSYDANTDGPVAVYWRRPEEPLGTYDGMSMVGKWELELAGLSITQPITISQLAFCSTPNRSIPDNDSFGTFDFLTVDTPGTIVDVDIIVSATHSYVGDLKFEVSHGGATATIIDRPGVPETSFGCGGNDVDATIDDEGQDGNVEEQCMDTSPAIAGEFVGGDPPDSNLLTVFDGMDMRGSWSVNVSDHADLDVGTLNEWCVVPTFTPPPSSFQCWCLNAVGYPDENSYLPAILAQGSQ